MKKQKLEQLIKDNSQLRVEVYAGMFSDIHCVDALHTDNCRFVDISINDIKEDDILDFSVVSADDYNRTIEANSCAEEENATIIIIIKK